MAHLRAEIGRFYDAVFPTDDISNFARTALTEDGIRRGESCFWQLLLAVRAGTHGLHLWQGDDLLTSYATG